MDVAVQRDIRNRINIISKSKLIRKKRSWSSSRSRNRKRDISRIGSRSTRGRTN